MNSMSFPRDVKVEALTKSRRCCCICEEFAGLYTNVHHIVQEADGGPNAIENAIVLCLRCHGEVGHYNSRHPIGNSYTPAELKLQRDHWWAVCERNPTTQLPKLPISVSPDALELVSDGWRTNNVLTVHNKADAVYYDVWIRVALELTNILTSEIDIKDLAVAENVFQGIGGYEVSGDCIMLGGADQEGRPLVYLLLSNVAPGDTSKFTLTVDKKMARGTDYRAMATMEVVAFSRTPRGQFMARGENQVARSIIPPEPFVPGSVKLKFRKAGEN